MTFTGQRRETIPAGPAGSSTDDGLADFLERVAHRPLIFSTSCDPDEVVKIPASQRRYQVIPCGDAD